MPPLLTATAWTSRPADAVSSCTIGGQAQMRERQNALTVAWMINRDVPVLAARVTPHQISVVNTTVKRRIRYMKELMRHLHI